MNTETSDQYVEREMKRLILKVNQIGQYVVSSSQLNGLKVITKRHSDDELAKIFSRGWMAYFYSGKVQERVVDSVQFPLTLKDHFKEVFAPAWWLARWPVQYKTINTRVEHLHTCPHIDIDPVKGRELHISFLANRCDPQL